MVQMRGRETLYLKVGSLMPAHSISFLRPDSIFSPCFMFYLLELPFAVFSLVFVNCSFASVLQSAVSNRCEVH